MNVRPLETLPSLRVTLQFKRKDESWKYDLVAAANHYSTILNKMDGLLSAKENKTFFLNIKKNIMMQLSVHSKFKETIFFPKDRTAFGNEL